MVHITNSTSADQLPVGRPASAKPASAKNADFETFLTLLTAQMRNQDPLKPMDATAFVAELATFSSVEQQIQTNAKLDALLSSISRNGAVGISAWIGKTVGYEGPVNYSGQPVQVGTPVDPAADSATLIVRDLEGREIERVGIPTDTDSIMWPMAGAATPAPASGLYRIEVSSFRNGVELGVRNVSISGEAVAVRIDGGVAKIILSSGVEIPASEINSIGINDT